MEALARGLHPEVKFEFAEEVLNDGLKRRGIDVLNKPFLDRDADDINQLLSLVERNRFFQALQVSRAHNCDRLCSAL